MFDPQHLQGASPELVQSMFKIGWKATELKRTKLQSKIQRQQSELRRKRLENRLKMASKETGQGKGGVGKNPKFAKMEADDEEIEDLEELLEEPVQGKKRKTQSLYSALGKDEFVTGSKDRKSRLDARQKRIAAAEKEKDDDDDDEEETEEERLKREMMQLQSELQKTERAMAAAHDKIEREKAKRFSARLQEGKFLKQPKAVTLVAVKMKRKSLKTETIKSTDEEDEPDTIPEGFHLQESPHCLNMQRSEDYQAYLCQVVGEFKRLLKTGGRDIEEAYGQVIESFYWACRANKNNIIEDVDRDEILQSIKDPTCKSWKMKLTGRKMLDPTSIIQEEPIGPQTA